MSIYKKRSKQFNESYLSIKKRHKVLGILRVLAFCGIIYSFYLFMRQENYYLLLLTGGILIFFLVLLRLHVSMTWKLEYQRALKDINNDEKEFLEDDVRKFDGGKEFEVQNHTKRMRTGVDKKKTGNQWPPDSFNFDLVNS